jgi:circadian clock protein KaiB
VTKKQRSNARFAAAAAATTRVEFRLYVAGSSDRSLRAIQNARRLCDAELAGHSELEVIDIFQQPARARRDQILAVPTLVRHLPLPIKRFVGDLSNRAVLLAGLGLVPEPT